MARHTLSHANELFWGNAQYAPYKNALRGIELTPLTLVSLGTPAVADTDLILNDATATDSPQVITTFLAQPDVPRALQAVGTAGANHAVTITGTDEYDRPMVETLTLNGTTPVVAQKAFKTVTQVDVAAGAAGDTFDLGTTDAIGIPFRIDEGKVLAAYAGGALDLSTDATPVIGVVANADTTSPATATTNDVRGTYNPVATLNGSTLIQLLIRIDPTDKVTAFGVDQFAG